VDPVMKTEQKEVQDWAVQNDNKPLWTRSPREVRASAMRSCMLHSIVVLIARVTFCTLDLLHFTMLPLLSPSQLKGSGRAFEF
jgi:hypothetical protein